MPPFFMAERVSIKFVGSGLIGWVGTRPLPAEAPFHWKLDTLWEPLKNPENIVNYVDF